VNSELDGYYGDVNLLYHLGYAKINPVEYGELKQDIKSWFAKMGRSFKSWENTPMYSALPPPATKAAHRSCASPNRAVSVTRLAQATYPDSARSLGIGDATVGIKVTVGPSGDVVNTEVAESSSVLAIDQAALEAARQSRYAPELEGCEPTTVSVLLHFDVRPSP
jgi:TonB family protein